MRNQLTQSAEPTDQAIDAAVHFALMNTISSDYPWPTYMRDLYRIMRPAEPAPTVPQAPTTKPTDVSADRPVYRKFINARKDGLEQLQLPLLIDAKPLSEQQQKEVLRLMERLGGRYRFGRTTCIERLQDHLAATNTPPLYGKSAFLSLSVRENGELAIRSANQSQDGSTHYSYEQFTAMAKAAIKILKTQTPSPSP